jgi:hypothetical protein
MVEQKTPVPRRRLGTHGMMFRRRRIFARLREGFTYEEIAAEEGLSPSRVRKIVSKELRQRAADDGTEHAKLQLERLMPAVQLAAEAIAAGDVTAIAPYLKTLDRLDRYQVTASANQAYDDEARRKLIDKVNRMAENYGIDEHFEAAVREHMKNLEEMPPGTPVAEALKVHSMFAGKFEDEANAPDAPPAEEWAGAGFFTANQS